MTTHGAADADVMSAVMPVVVDGRAYLAAARRRWRGRPRVVGAADGWSDDECRQREHHRENGQADQRCPPGAESPPQPQQQRNGRDEPQRAKQGRAAGAGDQGGAGERPTWCSTWGASPTTVPIAPVIALHQARSHGVPGRALLSVRGCVVVMDGAACYRSRASGGTLAKRAGAGG